MARIIAFFNHKGGVGKTTSSYNVAWGLCKAGKRVLMIDADAQCNLTEIIVEDYYLNGDITDPASVSAYNSEFFYENNVYTYFVDYIQPTPNKVMPTIKTFKKESMNNLELLPGSIRFAELEKSAALSLANVPGLGHVPSSVYDALRKISKDVDYVLVDLSPALSSINQLFLMLADYFILPANPSIFSRQALTNLGDVFKIWNRELAGFEVFIKKLKPLPKMLGIICQNYRPYSKEDEKNTKSARRFEEMMTDLNNHASALATSLSGFNMALTEKEFNSLFVASTPYRIASIPDFNQLVVISEKEKIPVIALDSVILNKYKINTPQYQQKINDFIDQYNLVVDGLLKLQ